MAFEKFLHELPVQKQNLFQQAYRNIDPVSLLSRVRKLDDADQARGPRRRAEHLEKLLNILGQLTREVAIGIQANPDIVSLIVGGIKVVVDIALKYIEFFKRLFEMIGRLTEHLRHLQEFAKISDSGIIQTATANVYGGVLRFCHEAYLVFQDEQDRLRKIIAWRSLLRVQWQPYESKFGAMDNHIQHHLRILQFSAQAVTLNTANHNEEFVDKEVPITERLGSIEWISNIDFDGDQDAVLQKRWLGTGEWLWEHRDVQAWFHGNGSDTLWFNGPPGVGKSVLTSTVIDSIKEATKASTRTVIVFVYIKNDTEATRKPPNIIATFIKQLCDVISEVPAEILGLFRKNKLKADQLRLRDVHQLFVMLAQRFKRIYIVLDALDECEEGSRDLLLQLLLDYAELLQQVKVLITSRPQKGMSYFFEGRNVSTIAVEPRHLNPDIRIYVEGRVVSSLEPFPEVRPPGSQILRVENPALQARIFDSLTKSKDDVFFWVELQLDKLCRQNSDTGIQEALLELPRNSSGIYNRVITGIKDHAQRLQALAYVCGLWILRLGRSIASFEFRRNSQR